MYICPVCGYERLSEPPENFSICSCCGTEFGYDDFEASYVTLRSRWIGAGYRWFSPIEQPTADWEPTIQLKNLQFLQDPEPTTQEEASAPFPKPEPSFAYC